MFAKGKGWDGRGAEMGDRGQKVQLPILLLISPGM